MCRTNGSPPKSPALDNMSGDIEALADRLAGIRSWAYIAHRSDWLKEPAKWAERTREVEARLSDALHERLTQRFVDRRTSLLMRDLGKKGAGEFPVLVDEEGEVSVGSYAIGRLQRASPSRSIPPRGTPTQDYCCSPLRSDGLGDELERRANVLIDATDESFALDRRGRWRPRRCLGWAMSSRALLRDARSSSQRSARPGHSTACRRRHGPRCARGLRRWLDAQIEQAAASRWRKLAAAASDPASSPGVRALAAMLTDAAGVLPRKAALERDRPPSNKPTAMRCTSCYVRLGPLDVFLPPLLKPAAQYWRAALIAVRHGPSDADYSPAARCSDAGRRRRPARRRPRLPPRGPHRGFGSISPTVSPATRARCVRPAATTRSTSRSRPRSVSTRRPSARLMDEVGFARAGDAWRWRGRARVRAADRRGPPNPRASPSSPSSKKPK